MVAINRKDGMKTRYKFIHFKPEQFQWACLQNRGGSQLGIVAWYDEWKTFIFMPDSEFCVFSADCLADIQHFMGQLTHVA